jgi:mannitol/fructose-specific phosphotransferase system IIA component (Ntr-type)
MFGNFDLTKEFIQFKDEVRDWEEAVVESSKPLLDNGFVKQSYIDAMIECIKEYGPYVVIAPNLALPHARPETGSVKVGFSIMKLKKAVAFSEAEDHQVRLLIALSCVDADMHMKMLQGIVEVLSDSSKFEAILNATSKDEMLELFKI